jgi:four helix bundle protein
LVRKAPNSSAIRRFSHLRLGGILNKWVESGIREQSHKDLDVWRVSMELVEEVYRLTAELPNDEKYGLVSQMRRCAVSIPSNVAEGKGRGTTKDYRRFVQHSYGSGAELETQIEICIRLGFFTQNQTVNARSLLDRTMRMLNKLIRSLG